MVLRAYQVKILSQIDTLAHTGQLTESCPVRLPGLLVQYDTLSLGLGDR